MGVFGFFISTDLFTMFMFYEVACHPDVPADWRMGFGTQGIRCHETDADADGRFASFLFIGILGIYSVAAPPPSEPAGDSPTAQYPRGATTHLVPAYLPRFRRAGRSVPVPYLEAQTVMHPHLPPSACCMPGVLMKLGGYGCFRIAMYLMPEAAPGARLDIPRTDGYLRGVRRILRLRADRPEVHQRLLFRIALRTGAFRHPDDEPDGLYGCRAANAFPRIDDRPVLRPYRYDIGRTHTRDVRELSGLMKVMPFLAVSYVIAGLANLGLPGLSGFIAEMTIFNGAFQHPDTFHRAWTVIACTSIVITAVYILRLVGKILYGACTNKHHLTLTDATWDERTAVIILIACVAGLGLAPLWISNMIGDSVLPVVNLLATH